MRFLGSDKNVYEIKSCDEVELHMSKARGDYVIPSCVEHEGITYRVTSIFGTQTFIGCRGAFRKNRRLNSVIIPKSVQTIGPYAFEDCINLNMVNIENESIDIGKYAFSGTQAKYNGTIEELKKIPHSDWHKYKKTCPIESHSEIIDGIIYEGNILKGCSGILAEGSKVSVRQGTTQIAYEAFDNQLGLEEIFLPNSVTEIRGYAFSGCKNLRSLTGGENLFIFESSALSGTQLKEKIENAKDDVIIGKVLLHAASKTEVNIPKGVETIASYAFNHNESKIINIPNGVKRIDSDAFFFSSAESITIPESVEYLGNDIIVSNDLKEVHVGWKIQPIDIIEFVDRTMVRDHGIKLFIQAGTKKTYSLYDGWNIFASIFEE